MVTADVAKLLAEFRAEVKTERRKALIDAYLAKSAAEHVADAALRLLSKALDDN